MERGMGGGGVLVLRWYQFLMSDGQCGISITKADAEAEGQEGGVNQNKKQTLGGDEGLS